MQIPERIKARMALLLVAPALYGGKLAGETRPDQQALAAQVDALVSELANTNYAAREQASKALLALPVEALPALRQQALVNADLEVQLRLQSAIAALGTIEATTTPPISVDFKDATYEEVAEALTKATGTPVEGDALASHDRFTLSADSQPFWEVIDRLSQQHSMSLAERAGLTLKPRNDPSARHRQFVRGVLFSVGEPRFDGNMVLRVGRAAPAGPSSRVSLSVGVAVDPRIAVYQTRPPIFIEGKDDQGGMITSTEAEETIGKTNLDFPSRLWDRTFSLLGPAALGTKLSLKGSVSFAVVVQGEASEISAPEKHLGEAKKVGDLSVTVRQVISAVDPRPVGTLGIRAVGLRIEVVPARRPGKPPEVGDMTIEGAFIHTPNSGQRGGSTLKGQSEGRVMLSESEAVVLDGMYRFDASPPDAAGQGMVPLEVTILDVDGREILSRKLTVSSASTIILGTRSDVKEPARVIFRSGEVRNVTVPFEFKDLPVKK